MTIVELFGVSGGPTKAVRPSITNKREADREYDHSKHKRTFQNSWKEGRPWLTYDEELGVMFCTTCKANKYKRADPTSSFATKGASSLQLHSVVAHEASNKYKREQEARDAANRGPTDETPAEKMRAKMNEKRPGQLMIKFRTKYG